MKNESRTEKRKEMIHQSILQVASRIISEKGAANITFEALSVEADVARKTIYNHFENKSVLLEELIYPICEHAKDYLLEKTEKDQIVLDDIWDYCIELWKNQSLNAAVLYQITEEDYPQIHEIKNGFLILFKKLLMRVEGYNQLDENNITILADTIYTTYLPFLGSIRSIPYYENAFKIGMSGMIDALYKLMKKSNI